MKPSDRHTKQLTALEKRTGWRYQIVATNITGITGVAGSHPPQWLDALQQTHACVEDHVRAGKATGLRNPPSKARTVIRGWVLTCKAPPIWPLGPGCSACTTDRTLLMPNPAHCA